MPDRTPIHVMPTPRASPVGRLPSQASTHALADRSDHGTVRPRPALDVPRKARNVHRLRSPGAVRAG